MSDLPSCMGYDQEIALRRSNADLAFKALWERNQRFLEEYERRRHERFPAGGKVVMGEHGQGPDLKYSTR